MRITYIHHSSFLVELDKVYLLFDYTEGRLPDMKKDKDFLVFASHRHGDHYSRAIFELMASHERTRYILSSDIWRKRLPGEILERTESMKPGELLTIQTQGGEVKVWTYRSTDEGVAFLVSCEGRQIYHAGDLNDWQWSGEPKNWNDSMRKKYGEEVGKMAGMHMNVAFLPLDPRQEDDFYLGMDRFLTRIDVDHVFPMHCWGDFSVIGRIKGMDCSSPYRDRIVDIHEDGEVFELE